MSNLRLMAKKYCLTVYLFMMKSTATPCFGHPNTSISLPLNDDTIIQTLMHLRLKNEQDKNIKLERREHALIVLHFIKSTMKV